MQSDDPAFLPIGTEVSAKFKGAFCEAKVKRMFRVLKFKVTLKEPPYGNIVVEESHFKGDPAYEVNELVEVSHNQKFVKAQIMHVKDCSTYEVVFDDGDERRLRRTQMVLKGAKHYNEAHNLDALPLYNPEQFGSPVVAKIIRKNKMKKRERESRSSGGGGSARKERPEPEESSEDDEPTSSRGSRMTTRGRIARTGSKTTSDNEGDNKKRRGKRRAKRAAAHAANAAIADQGVSTEESEEDEEGSENEDEECSDSGREDDRKPDSEKIVKKKKDRGKEKTGKEEKNYKEDKKERVKEKDRLKFSSGDVVLVFSDAKKQGNSNPAVVVNVKIYKALKGMKPLGAGDIAVRSFLMDGMQGRYYGVSPSVLRMFKGRIPSGIEKDTLKQAFSRAKEFLETNGKSLPTGWNLKEHILGDTPQRKRESSSSSSESSSSGSSEDERDEEFQTARDCFVAYFYKFQEESATPINRQPVLGGKPLDIYRFYKVVDRMGGWKRVCAEGKWRKVLVRMKLEGCPGATSATVKNAYHRYLLPFAQQYNRLGWSLNELTVHTLEGRRQSRSLMRQATGSKEKKHKRKLSLDDDREKPEKKKEKKEESEEKEVAREEKRDVKAVEKEKSDKEKDKEKVEKKEKKRREDEKETEEKDRDKEQKEKKKREKDDDEAEKKKKDRTEEREKEKDESKEKKKREHISPSPARSTASTTSKDDKERKKEHKEKERENEKIEKERERDKEKEAKEELAMREFKRERSVAKDILSRKERKRTDSVSTTSDEESRKRKEKRKSISFPGTSKERSAEKGEGPERGEREKGKGSIDDQEEGYLQAHILCQFRQGQNVRALHLGSWYNARVLTSETPKIDQLVKTLKPKTSSEQEFSTETITGLRELIEKTRAFVHYLGWNSRYDEWIQLHKVRVSLKDEEESRTKTLAAMGGQISEERIKKFLEWSSSPDGVASFRGKSADEKKTFLHTIGPYRPRRFSISQVEQISESIHLQELQQQAARTTTPSVSASTPVSGSSAHSGSTPQVQPAPVTTCPQKPERASSTQPPQPLIVVGSRSPSKSSEVSKEPSPAKDRLVQVRASGSAEPVSVRRVRTPVKETAPASKDIKDVRLGSTATHAKKDASVRLIKSEKEGEIERVRLQKEREEKEQKDLEERERRVKEEKEKLERERVEREERQRREREREELKKEEERMRKEEERRKEEEERKKKEEDERKKREEEEKRKIEEAERKRKEELEKARREEELRKQKEEEELKRKKEEEEKRRKKEEDERRKRKEEDKKRREEEERKKKKDEEERKRKEEEKKKRDREREEEKRKKEDERKRKEKEEREKVKKVSDDDKQPLEEKERAIKRRKEDERESVKSGSSAESEVRLSPTAKRLRKEDKAKVEEETETDRLLEEARSLCAQPQREESDVAASGGETPQHEVEQDDADKWSVSDNQSIAGSHLTSPSRGFRGKRKRAPGRQPAHLKKKAKEKEEGQEGEDDDESEEEIEVIHKETFYSLRKALIKVMENEGTIDNYANIGIDPLAYPYDYQPKNLEEARQIMDYVLNRQDDLRCLYDESKAIVVQTNKKMLEWRIKQKQREREEAHAAAAALKEGSGAEVGKMAPPSTAPPTQA